jgi:tryptophan 2,3-dioxygenase
MDDLNKPVLPGTAATDYERYLRTDELLSLQKPAAEQVNDDELLFQVVHQSAELWLKLACADVDRATPAIDGEDLASASRWLRRAASCVDLVTANTHMLEHMSPWDYHTIRKGLGHGSGFDSPGFRQVHHLTPLLGEAFSRLLERRGVDLVAIYTQRAEHADVFDIAERLIDWDERVTIWKFHHLKLVERIIGGHVIGTQGTPVEVLGKRIDVSYFADLWDVRNRLTHLSKTSPTPTPGHGR